MADEVTGTVETQQVDTPAAAPAAEAGGSSQTDVNTPKQVPLAALQEERNTNRELRAEIEALKRVVGSTSGIPTGGQPGQLGPGFQQGNPNVIQAQPMETQQAPQISKEELDRMWMEDPRKAMQTEMGLALNWYDKMNAQVDSQEEHLARTFKDFDTYRADVRKYIRQLPPEQRSKPGVVELAYYVVRGQSVEKTVQQQRDDIVNKIKAGESVQGVGPGTSSSSRVTTPAQISADEARVASKMGMTPEEYLKHKK